jgi:hypothetical protein
MSIYTFDLTDAFTAAKQALTVTRLNKAWKNSMALKQGDQALDFVCGAQVDVTATGTQNNYAPGTGVAVSWNGASQITITGLVAHLNGDLRIIHNSTAALPMKLTHQDAGSTAANRIILPSTCGQWIGPGGSIGLRYDGVAARWRVLFIHPGTWIAVGYAAGDYTASAGTWTVDAGDFAFSRFKQTGTEVAWDIEVTLTSVSNAGAFPRAAYPAGFTVATGRTSQLFRSTDNGVVGTGLAILSTAGYAEFRSSPGGAGYAISVNNTSIQASMRLEVS